MGSTLDLLLEVREGIEKDALPLKDAARQIGVTLESLERHLRGEYVRSDSQAKYRTWLAGRSRKETQLALLDISGKRSRKVVEGEKDDLSRITVYNGRPTNDLAFLVVDLFSGCGGLSAGFELLDNAGTFNTVLAVDVEDAMVRAYNENASRHRPRQYSTCRKADVSDFLNEAEVLAFYLDHIADRLGDADLRSHLDALPGLGLSEFKRIIVLLDRTFIEAVANITVDGSFKSEYAGIPAKVSGQTSVQGFCKLFHLPLITGQNADIDAMVWADPEADPTAPEEFDRFRAMPVFHRIQKANSKYFAGYWNTQVNILRTKSGGGGSGQLASSARRIRAFTQFLEGPSMAKVKEAWVSWQSHRSTLRSIVFDNPRTEAALRYAYTEGRRVSVLLGGPPCQGFSRVGRGKIRSLRESGVHVHSDPEAGDTRNRLLNSYVLFVSALSPSVFLFENVRHFQAKVRTRDGTFLASDILAEAIHNTSHAGLSYKTATRVIDASRHLIPQKRERYFMVGIRSDVVESASTSQLAEWSLCLPERGPVPLQVALQGLPDPYIIGEGRPDARLSLRAETTLTTEALSGPAGDYVAWIRMQSPASGDTISQFVDAHYTRPTRSDDRAFFRLMGPGTRWMDYRCDGSKTLAQISTFIARLRQAVEAALKTEDQNDDAVTKLIADLDIDQLDALSASLDGSLSIRLLLESIDPLPGELHHHLLMEGYLSKREGNHGDWLSRLNSARPSKTMVSHMGKDTYGFVHPWQSRTLSVREAARVQSFPDWYAFGFLSLVDAFRVIGNAVPPLLSYQLAKKIAQILWGFQAATEGSMDSRVASNA